MIFCIHTFEFWLVW